MVFLPRWLAHTSRSHVLTMVLILMLALMLSWDFVAHLLLVLVSHAILRVPRGADWRHPCNCDTRMFVVQVDLVKVQWDLVSWLRALRVFILSQWCTMSFLRGLSFACIILNTTVTAWIKKHLSSLTLAWGALGMSLSSCTLSRCFASSCVRAGWASRSL